MRTKNTGTITFRNDAQAVLWEHEITGQLSDGHWENSRPHDHWMCWCDAEVKVSSESTQLGRDFTARREKYNLASSELLEIVGKRMINYVRLSKHFGPTNVSLLTSTLDIDGNFRGAPTYKGEHYDKIREELKSFDLEEVRRVIEDESLFSWIDLIRELNDMKRIMRTIKPQNPEQAA